MVRLGATYLHVLAKEEKKLTVLIFFNIVTVDCGPPEPPMNGSTGNYSSMTTLGATVTYVCDKFFLPITTMISRCSSNGLWDPAPHMQNCTIDGK